MKLQFDKILFSDSEKTKGYVLEGGIQYYVELEECGCCSFSFNHNLHREDGPASISCERVLEWFYNGKRHREDGPAYIEIDDDYAEYWLDNKYLSMESFLKELKPKIIYVKEQPYLIDGRPMRDLDLNDDY